MLHHKLRGGRNTPPSRTGARPTPATGQTPSQGVDPPPPPATPPATSHPPAVPYACDGAPPGLPEGGGGRPSVYRRGGRVQGVKLVDEGYFGAAGERALFI